MKEVTYADRVKNPTPRMMWVWDDNAKVKRKVIYFIENKDVSHPVIALSSDGITTTNYKHCAEIEEPRRMTYNVIFIREHYKPRDKQYSAVKDVIRGKSWRWL